MEFAHTAKYGPSHMDLRTMTSSIASLSRGRGLSGAFGGAPHVVDQLISERTTGLATHPLWPYVRPALYRFLHYGQAVRMADRIAPMSGWDALAFISELLSLEICARGLDNLPKSGAFILAPSHPTGIADGIAVFDTLKAARPDMAIFANRDALRVTPGFRDMIIPVEWRAGEKTHAKSRDTLELTARAFNDGKAVVLFASGRIAYWNEGVLTERPWQNSLVALARRYEVPVVPVNISARNSGLFYLLSKYSNELRDMTLFHELLNKKGKEFLVTIGRPIPPEALHGDAAELTSRLQHHTVTALLENRHAVFSTPLPEAA